MKAVRYSSEIEAGLLQRRIKEKIERAKLATEARLIPPAVGEANRLFQGGWQAVALGPVENHQIGPVSADRPEKVSKYRSKRTNGYASKKEAERAEQLKLLEKSGTIRNLREQVRFQVIPRQYDERGKLIERACVYVSDFVYEEPAQDCKTTQYYETIVEDVKSEITRKNSDYVIKRKLMLHVHNIRIREV